MPYFTNNSELNDLQITMNVVFLFYRHQFTKTLFDEMSRGPQGTGKTMTISGPIIVETRTWTADNGQRFTLYSAVRLAVR